MWLQSYWSTGDGWRGYLIVPAAFLVKGASIHKGKLAGVILAAKEEPEAALAVIH